jgi:hypothetical protein
MEIIFLENRGEIIMAKFEIRRETFLYWFLAIAFMAIICFALMFFTETQVPSTLTSSGIVAIISAIIGVILSVLVTQLLLKNQSKTEAEKDKDVEIHKEKIKVFSKFNSELWKMVDDWRITPEKIYNKFKTMCFDELIFYLSKNEINALKETISKIDAEKQKEYTFGICKITNILQNSLWNTKEDNAGHLKDLYELLDEKQYQKSQDTLTNVTTVEANKYITFWHFNMWGDAQIEAFKRNNWILSLFECEEDWRTNLLMQVKKDDVIFLFRRGGSGYIGAFRATGTEKYTIEDWKKLNDETKKEKDIYNAFNVNQATLVSNIAVKPIAYNNKGIGYYWTVRRRTIERMNDQVSIKYLLSAFRGKFEDKDLEEYYVKYYNDCTDGKGKFGDGSTVVDDNNVGINEAIKDFNNQCNEENKIKISLE